MNKLSKWHRHIKAAIIVSLLVGIVPASGLIGGASSRDSVVRNVDDGIDAAGLVAGFNHLESLERLEELTDVVPTALPRYFDEEIGLPAGAFDARVNSDGLIVGYVVDDVAESAHQLVSQHMVASGWSEVGLGAVQGSTYLKSSGSCKWALATFTQVGSTTSVVFRCVVS